MVMVEVVEVVVVVVVVVLVYWERAAEDVTVV